MEGTPLADLFGAHLEHGRQPDRRHAEVGEIVDLLAYPSEIATMEGMGIRPVDRVVIRRVAAMQARLLVALAALAVGARAVAQEVLEPPAAFVPAKGANHILSPFCP